MISKRFVYYSCVGDGLRNTVLAYVSALKSVRDRGESSVKVFPLTKDTVLDVARNGFIVYGERSAVVGILDDINERTPIKSAPVIS
mgnify:CR=1 FL=1|tara:strand:+ start:1922 stop:2179 length:258 start_codon:yes stop_codon:yes gene_type:complete